MAVAAACLGELLELSMAFPQCLPPSPRRTPHNVTQVHHTHRHRHSHKRGSDLTDIWLRIICCHYSWNLKWRLRFTRICRMWQSERDWIWLKHTSAYTHPSQAEEYTGKDSHESKQGWKKERGSFHKCGWYKWNEKHMTQGGGGVALKLPVVPHHLLPI